ncbi:MAG: transglycosylase SLT domain-containing protein [Nitrospirota bacterium]
MTGNIFNDNISSMRYIIAIFGIIFLIFPVAYADIYKYIDDNGVICYTDAPVTRNVNKFIKKDTNRDYAKQKPVKKNSEKITNYKQIVYEKAAIHGIDPSLIKAVIQAESNWNSTAVSKKGAMGLMQIMPVTASKLKLHNPFSPEENIEAGIRYLKYLIERFKGDLTLALAAYNAGPKIVEKFGFVPPITETKQYVNKVLSLYNGKTKYLSTKDSKKLEKIYKIILEDGTVIFTNSTFCQKNAVRF